MLDDGVEEGLGEVGAVVVGAPRVRATPWPSRASRSRISGIGRGVVVTTCRGSSPSRNPNCSMSQVVRA